MSLIQRLNNVRNVGYSERQQSIIDELYGLEKPREFEKLEISETEISELYSSVEHYITTTASNGQTSVRLRRTLDRLTPRRKKITKKKTRSRSTFV